MDILNVSHFSGEGGLQTKLWTLNKVFIRMLSMKESNLTMSTSEFAW